MEKQLTDIGYQLIAISPDLPAEMVKSKAKHEINYTLLSDSKMKAAKAFGLAFKVDDETYAALKGYGIDLEQASGETHHMLPVPAVFIIGQDGVVHFMYSNPDYKVRIDPDELLKAAKKVMEH